MLPTPMPILSSPIPSSTIPILLTLEPAISIPLIHQLKMESINLGIAHEIFIPKKDLISMVNSKDLNSKIINDWRGSNMSKKVYEEIILFLEKS